MRARLFFLLFFILILVNTGPVGCGGGSSSNANLSALSLSAGSLSPTFDPDTTNYTVSLGFAATALQAIPTLADPNATVRVEGNAVESGAASDFIPLSEGDNTLSIVVTASNGSSMKIYTLTVTRAGDSSFAQSGYLQASNLVANDAFGTAVSASNDTLVVGVENQNSAEGAAYVFARDANGDWSEQAYLKADNAEGDDRFGVSVSISFDTVVVGSSREDGSDNLFQNNSGAAYVFVRASNGTWTQQAYLKADNLQAGDIFGNAVAISGDTLVVGSPNEDGLDDGTQNNSGAAYVFVRDASGDWTQQAYLKADNAEADDSFGNSVSISGDTVVVGSAVEGGSGAAYVFVRDANGDWSQQAYLKADNAEAGDGFGSAVSVSGDTLAVSAPIENGLDDGSQDSSGAAYVFVRDASGDWTQQAYLKADNVGASDFFGSSLSISGDTLVVGSINEDGPDDGSQANSGAAYVFMRDSGGDWTQQLYLKSDNIQAGDSLGYSTAVSGDVVVAGARGEDGLDNGNQDSSGAVYVFE